MPSDWELKSRLTQTPATEREGKSADRACRTCASASSVRNVASATVGASPAARRTASANESRTGACAASGAAPSAASIATSRKLLFRDTMEGQVDMGVEIFPLVEAFLHAGREGETRHDGVHQRRHRELRGDHDVDRPELAV